MTIRYARYLAACLLGGLLASRAVADAPKPIEDPARTGSPTGRERTGAGRPTGQPRELRGTVVRADAKTVYLEHMGAIVAMRIDERTRFSGEGVKSVRDLAEGQEVRASFTVSETTNVAETITLSGGGTSSGGLPVPPEREPGLPRPGTPGVPRDPGTLPPRDPGTVPPRDPGMPPVKH